MRIRQLTIENFRSIRKETVTFGEYTALVGPNGSGKSTILTALRTFFRDTSGSPTDLVTLQEQDFHLKDTSKDIVITVEFVDLDAEAEEEFQHYYRHKTLIVSAVASWDANARSAVVKQYGERMGIKDFAEFFKAEKSGKLIDELRALYGTLKSKYDGLPKEGTKPVMVKALREYEAGHPDACVPIRSEDEFYGFSKGTNRLQKFVQWVFVPAVKDASTEQLEAKKNALGVLLERTVRSKLDFDAGLRRVKSAAEAQFQELLNAHQHTLESLSSSLNQRMKSWAHPEANIRLQWHSDAAQYVSIEEPLAQVLAGEGNFSGDIARFGHGLQRSFLFALLQELSGCQNSGNPRLILACEEPELHQHPPQARHLATVLRELSEGNTQVIVCTHSPYFVNGSGFEDVRLIRKDVRAQETRSGYIVMDELSKEIGTARGETPASSTGIELKVEQALQPELSEMFFSSVLVLVEGLEDVAFIETYLTLLDLWDDFRGLGCHIVSTSGKNKMIQPRAIAKLLGIPTFCMFDCDGDKIEKNDKRKMHEMDNLALFNLCSFRHETPFPSSAVHVSGLAAWPNDLANSIHTELGHENWAACELKVRQKRGITDSNLDKNMLFIGSVLTEAWQLGVRSAVLENLCRSILEFASKSAA